MTKAWLEFLAESAPAVIADGRNLEAKMYAKAFLQLHETAGSHPGEAAPAIAPPQPGPQDVCEECGERPVRHTVSILVDGAPAGEPARMCRGCAPPISNLHRATDAPGVWLTGAIFDATGASE